MTDLSQPALEQVMNDNIKLHPEFNKLLKVDNEYMIQYSIDTDQYIMILSSLKIILEG